MSNDKRKLRVIGKKNGLYLLTSNPNATMDDIFEKGFIITSSGEQISPELLIGTLIKQGYWEKTNGTYYEFIKDKNYNYTKDALLGAAVGDAFGVPYEFLSRAEIEELDVSEMIGSDTNPTFKSRWNQLIPSGAWSDDTSMIIATMDSIIKQGDIDYNKTMKNYIRWWNTAQFSSLSYPFGLGNTISKSLQKFKSGILAEECGGKDYMDNGNGSLMRILPFSLYCIKNNLSEEDTLAIISNGSSLTHGNEISIMACYMYTIFLKEAIRTRNVQSCYQKMISTDYQKIFSLKTILEFNNIISNNLVPIYIKESSYVVDTLAAVMYSLLHSDDYKETIIQCIKLGYDTDTIACIAGSLAGVIYGYEDIPKEWLEKLKKRDFLEKISVDFDKAI